MASDRVSMMFARGFVVFVLVLLASMILVIHAVKGSWIDGVLGAALAYVLEGALLSARVGSRWWFVLIWAPYLFSQRVEAWVESRRLV